MFSVQLIGVGVAAWILLGGITTIGKWFGTEWSVTVPFRAYAMLGSTVLYLLRNLVTLAVLLKRRVTWGEGLGLSITIAVIEIWYHKYPRAPGLQHAHSPSFLQVGNAGMWHLLADPAPGVCECW